MKHFHEHQDDSMRSRLTDHEFDMPNGAWTDMEKRLDHFSTGATAASSPWAAWFVIGAMLLATTIGLIAYQWQMPYAGQQEKLAKSSEEPSRILTPTPVISSTENPTPSENKGVASTNIVKNNSSETIDKDVVDVTAHRQTQKASGQSDVFKEPKPNTVSKKTAAPVVLDKKKDGPAQNITSIANENEHKKSSYPILTRRTIVKHHFSENTLKWRNESLPALSAPNAVRGKRPRLMQDTPIIVLDNPMAEPKKVQFGLSAGVNTKVYGRAGNLSVAPVLGAFLRKRIDQVYTVEGGLSYKILAHQAAPVFGSSSQEPASMMINVDVDPSTEQDFQERAAKVYQLQQMHVLELPLSFLYQLHPKHQVAMGAKLAYVFGVQTSSAMIDNMPANDLGFSSLDLGALAAYEYSINEHFAVRVVYNVGFMNLANQTGQRAAHYHAMYGDNYEMSPVQQGAYQTDFSDAERMIPVQVDAEEQVFLDAPRNLYNSDLRLLLRYIF